MNIAFLLTSLIVIVSPGTGVLYTLATGLTRGSRASVVAAFGCTLGIVPHMAAAILGLAAVLHASAVAFQTLKYLGVAYLLYMAWSALREQNDTEATTTLHDGQSFPYGEATGENGQAMPDPGSVQSVQVGRLPHVGVEARVEQQRRVLGRREHGVLVTQHAADQRRPARRVGERAQQDVRRRVEVAGHLDRQPAAGGQPRRPVPQQRSVPGHPLQGCVAHRDVAIRGRRPVSHVADPERHAGNLSGGALDHLR